jgi:palmitoyltransferase
MRFLFYATVGMSYLETLIWERASFVWKNSHLPSVSESARRLAFRVAKNR